jgi:hypothetical protein
VNELAKSSRVFLELRLDLYDVIVRQQACALDRLEADSERMAVAGNFFGRALPASGKAASRNSSSWVVTMFSIAELSFASCRPSVLIRMP